MRLLILFTLTDGKPDQTANDEQPTTGCADHPQRHGKSRFRVFRVLRGRFRLLDRWRLWLLHLAYVDGRCNRRFRPGLLRLRHRRLRFRLLRVECRFCHLRLRRFSRLISGLSPFRHRKPDGGAELAAEGLAIGHHVKGVEARGWQTTYRIPVGAVFRRLLSRQYLGSTSAILGGDTEADLNHTQKIGISDVLPFFEKADPELEGLLQCE